MNGIQFAQAVRRDPRWKDLPLIAVTTRSDRRHREEGLRAGFTKYLEKVNPKELVASIEDSVSTLRGTA